MNSVVEKVCVEDVYDLASEIGKEFEKIIDIYGIEIITSLMPKVICALEQLEFCASRNDTVDLEISDLNSVIVQLQYEKIGKQEYKSKLEKELEQIEDIWREETNRLSELITELKEENLRLCSSLKEKENIISKKSSGCVSEQDLKIAQKLKEIVDRQREQIEQKDQELHHKCSDVEMLQLQLQKLVQFNKDLKSKQKYQQCQMKALVEEKMELQMQLEEYQRKLQQLRSQLGVAVKENLELAQVERKTVIDLDDSERLQLTVDEIKRIVCERNDLKAKMNKLQDELTFCKSQPPLKSDGVDPVQGPINKEPEEKLFLTAKPSRIHRFVNITGLPEEKIVYLHVKFR